MRSPSAMGITRINGHTRCTRWTWLAFRRHGEACTASGTTVRVVAQTSAGQRHSRGLADYAGAALAVAQPSSVNRLISGEIQPYLFTTVAAMRRARRGPWSLYRGRFA